jgi:hypothetical protein
VRRASWVVALAAALPAFATSAPQPSLAEAAADPAALAEFLNDCAARLTKNDVGLARVARVCPGIDYAIAHGPLAGSLRYRAWPRDLDRGVLRSVARLADTGALRAQITLDPARLKTELDRVNVQKSEYRNWWQRLMDRISHWMSASPSSIKLPDWLQVSPGALEWLGIIVTRVLPAAFLIGALILSLRRNGVLRRLINRISGPGIGIASGAREPTAPAPAGPTGLAERFRSLLATLESRGLISNARALTCRELARATAGKGDLEALGPIAGIVERLRYGDSAPASELLDDAQARLAALAQGLSA